MTKKSNESNLFQIVFSSVKVGIKYLWNYVVLLISVVWKVIVEIIKRSIDLLSIILNFLIKLFHVMRKFLKLVFFVVFGLAGSISVLIIALGLFIFLISKSFGLSESGEFQKFRERFLQVGFIESYEWIDEVEKDSKEKI